jgi:molecular chaperone GrpE
MADQEEEVTGPAEPGPVTAEMTEEEAQLEADMAALLQQRDDALDAARRVQADFENYRKRVLREQTALVERSTSGLVEQLLPVLDSFELAVVNLDSNDVDIEKVRKGVDLVFAEFLGVLEKAGLERIESAGEPFDPNEHEAVMQDDGDGDPIVGDVLRTGWKLKGRVLRPAMVKVVRPS